MILPKMPKHLLVVGAGAIGIEFAYFYATLGAKVTVVEFQDNILPINDRELASILMKSLQKRGIQIFTVQQNSPKSKSALRPSPPKSSAPRTTKRKPAVEADICLQRRGHAGQHRRTESRQSQRQIRPRLHHHR